jgi:hypothetical protein
MEGTDKQPTAKRKHVTLGAIDHLPSNEKVKTAKLKQDLVLWKMSHDNTRVKFDGLYGEWLCNHGADQITKSMLIEIKDRAARIWFNENFELPKPEDIARQENCLICGVEYAKMCRPGTLGAIESKEILRRAGEVEKSTKEEAKSAGVKAKSPTCTCGQFVVKNYQRGAFRKMFVDDMLASIGLAPIEKNDPVWKGTVLGELLQTKTTRTPIRVISKMSLRSKIQALQALLDDLTKRATQ